MLNVNFFNDTGVGYIPKKKIIKIAETVFANENQKLINTDANVNIILMTADNIKEINSQYLNHNWDTDVISFVIDKQPFLGEVYICIEVAVRQAKEYKVSRTDELLRLTAHGCLHLCDYDDDTPEKKEIMHKLEEKYKNYV